MEVKKVRKAIAGLLGVSLVSAGISVLSLPEAASAADPPPGRVQAPAGRHIQDEEVHPVELKRRQLRERAVDELVAGTAAVEKRGTSKVVKVGATVGAGRVGENPNAVGEDQYVELGRETTDRVFAILVEFGDERHPDFPDRDTSPKTAGPTRFDGPLHNQMPEPDRRVDNSTIWQANYSREHYQQLLFGTGKDVESLRTYYESQSSGRYSLDGTVTDWVKVRYNEARYGRSGDDPKDADGDDPAVCAQTRCSNQQHLVKDAANQWFEDQKARGRTAEQIKAELAAFDVHDRYDADADGNFDEPDGYLDRLQVIHAGGSESDGIQPQGEDAIWAHRGFAFRARNGRSGPPGNPLGGTQIGDTGLWIGDYTMQPENSGLAVIAHEYGHDLGLPDDYDLTDSRAHNNGHWTLMAQHRLSAPGEPIGTRPGDLGAWNKMQLGWLDYEIVPAKQQRTLELGPAEYNTAKPQAAVIVLPDQKITTDVGPPATGERQYFSGNADDLSSTMTGRVDLTGTTSAALTAKVRHAIEADADFLYVQASKTGQAPWTTLDGTVNGRALPRDADGAPALTGDTAGAWADLNVPLTAYAGAPVHLRFLYRTDGADSAGGFFADDVTVTADGAPVLTDGAEQTSAFTLQGGFRQVGRSVVGHHPHRYIAAHRSYVSYDKYLKTGPYALGHLHDPRKAKLVDHYPYQDGLLISYNNTFWPDNSTTEHPGQGRNLIIDANPRPFHTIAGTLWHPFVQTYDAPFSLEKSDSFTLHHNGQRSYVRGRPAKPLFDDTQQYWFEEAPAHGVKLPAAGVKIRVLERSGTTMKIDIS